MGIENHIMGLFTDDRQAAEAIQALRASQFTLRRVHGPIPSHRIIDALKQKKSRVGLFTLAGGILGFLSGYALAISTAVQWSLPVSGKPVVAPIPFLIVGFEFTILFAVFGNVIGMLTQARLPKIKLPAAYDPRCTGDRFGVLASCRVEEKDRLIDFFRQRGGEAKVFEGPV